jgi:hypothetical protein
MFRAFLSLLQAGEPRNGKAGKGRRRPRTGSVSANVRRKERKKVSLARLPQQAFDGYEYICS